MKRRCAGLLVLSLIAGSLNGVPRESVQGQAPAPYPVPGSQAPPSDRVATRGTTPPQVPDNPHHHTRPDPPIVQPRAGGGNELGESLAAAGGGLLAGLLIAHFAHSKNNPGKALSDQGPQTASLFSMSAITVVGFVKGSWPMAIDYEVHDPGTYLLTVSADGVAPFEYLLDGTRVGHQQQILSLPARFGQQARPATCTLRASSNVPGETRLPFMRVFGWGCGPRAVGSVAIDQVRFAPLLVRPRNKEAALYGFHSHADFEKVSAEFERVALVNGEIVAKLEDQQRIDDPVRINTEIANKRWDARKASAGQHLLQIRAWYSVNHGADWVIAWSPEIVSIVE